MSESSSTDRKSARKKTTINLILTHKRPHEDEIVGIMLLMMADCRFDARNARIVTVNDRDLVKCSDMPDVLYVGIGARLSAKCPGRVFDDHGKKEKNECAAEIVARSIGIDRGSFGKLLWEAHQHDLTRSSAVMSLATVLKVRYEHTEEGKVIAWAMHAAEVLYRHILSGKPVPRQSSDKIFEIASNAYAKIGKGSNLEPKVFQQLLTGVSATARSESLTDIGTVFNIMAAESLPDAVHWFETAMEDLVREQVSFSRALKEFTSSGSGGHQEVEIEVDFPGSKPGTFHPSPVRVAIMKSHRGNMTRVFRSKQAGGCEMLVLVNPRNQVQIFTDDSLNKVIPAATPFAVDLNNLVRMLRWAEICVAGRRPHGWWKMDQNGEHPGTDAWFFFQEGRMVLNGSNSSPDVAPTKLTLDDIVYILRHAFTRNGVERFMRENGVSESRVS